MKHGPLKIAVVRPYLTIKKGGAERYAVELIQGLSRAGHHVHAFAYDWDQPEQPGVTYHRVPMPRKPAWLRVLLFHFNLRRRLCLADYDGVLGLTPFWPQHVFWLGDGLYHAWVRIAWPLKLVRSMMCLKRAVMAVNLWMEKSILTSARSVFIANSKLVARQARRYYGVSKQRIHVIYPWLDRRRFNPEARARWRTETRRQLGILDAEIALCFAANNFKRKGLPVVLRALASIGRSDPSLRLIVVGAGQIGRFRRAATKLGLAEHTNFVGAVADIERYYAAADIFVLPTRYDPCATVCLEAMACGLPVITTSMNGAAEFIEDGESGFIQDENCSADSLARAIRSLASHKESSSAGMKAYERVSCLSAASHLEKVISLLRQSARPGVTTAVARLEPDMVVNRKFMPLLERHRLTSFAALLASVQRTEIEYNRNKRISLLVLDDDRKERRLFLKLHRERPSWARVLGRTLGWQRKTDGMAEWQNILDLQSAGIFTAAPVAAGDRLLPDGSRESFVMTQRLDGYLPLDRYIEAHFAAPGPDELSEKRLLIRALADLTRRMHQAGFHHRDFYLCHIFAKKSDSGPPDLRIIDLQRVGYRRFPSRRWLVKDLAQLHYSSRALPLTQWDRLRFLVQYGGLRAPSRRLSLAILRKSRAIEKHDLRMRARQNRQNFADPFVVSARLGQPSAPNKLDARQ